VRIASNLQPIRAQIDGSDDHGLVATSLLKASQSLVDRADQLRSQGFLEAADEALDDDAEVDGEDADDFEPDDEET
jgi:hypothetical protein